MLYQIKQKVPQPLLRLYHLLLAKLAAFWFRYPANQLIVIGVTGTNGKSSTVQFMAQMLSALGHRVGYTTTAGFNIAGQEIENKLKMTMPGRFYLQRLLREMVRAGCEYAIVETSSQGIEQSRHLGVNYDLALFTNLTPEHIEAHGGFENYKQAKGKLFAHLTAMPRKTIKQKEIPKVAVINADDPHQDYFASFKADRHVFFSWQGKGDHDHFCAQKISSGQSGIELKIKDQVFSVPLFAEFQHKNALAAMAGLWALDFSLDQIIKAAGKLHPIPGRFECLDQGQPFAVIVDYAYEPYAITALIESARQVFHPKRLIGIHGSAGGGRDVARRYQIGRLAAQEEDLVIVTNEDPYDEDPRQIIEQVAAGAIDAGKREGEDLLLINDRQAAINEAITRAQAGDVVLVTAKGSEPVMAVAGGKKIPWSDREVARQALIKAGYAR